MAQTAASLWFVWFFDHLEVIALKPTTVVVSQQPDGCWLVTCCVVTKGLEPHPEITHVLGMELGIADFAVTSDGDCLANPKLLERKAR